MVVSGGDLMVFSGAWPPRPPSPHAVLVVVPGMRQTPAIMRNVVQNVQRMGRQPFSCVTFLFEPVQSIPLSMTAPAGHRLMQVCTVVQWVGRNVIDYLKLLDPGVTRRFGGGVLVCMQAGYHKWPMPHQTEAAHGLVDLVVSNRRAGCWTECYACPRRPR